MAFELDPCRVHGEGGELVAAGHVRVDDGGSILVEAERFTGHSLDPGDPVVLEIASAVRGECTFDAVVLTSSARLIELGHLALRAVVQKRSAVRVPVTLPLTFTHDVTDGDPVPLDAPIEAVVLDVSAHGLRFRADAAVPTGTRLAAVFDATRRPVPVVVEVLRHDEMRSGVGHGCRFVGMAERDTDEMFSFVLLEQRRQLAERRDAQI